MVTIIGMGTYKLIQTKQHIKILYLDDASFAWINAKSIGEILVVSRNIHHTDSVLSMGHYFIYKVEDEVLLTDLQHLELEVGRDDWQGYLLPTGLPNEDHTRKRIIPTNQVITGNHSFLRNLLPHHPLRLVPQLSIPQLRTQGA